MRQISYTSRVSRVANLEGLFTHVMIPWNEFNWLQTINDELLANLEISMRGGCVDILGTVAAKYVNLQSIADLFAWGAANPHRLTWQLAYKGPQPGAYLWLVVGGVLARDSIDNTAAHLGFIVGPDSKLYASNGNGSNQKRTEIGTVSSSAPNLIEWRQKAASIEFWLDGAKAVVHTDYFPANAYNQKLLVTYQNTLGNTTRFVIGMPCYGRLP